MEDLWGFDKESLRCSDSTAVMILKEQGDLLSRKTDGILKGRIKSYLMDDVFSERNEKYNLETVLEVVVPRLDNYSSPLLYLYSNAERNFPVRVSTYQLNKEKLEEPVRACNRKYIVKHESDYIDLLRVVLQSKEINETIEVLYQKAWLE